MWLLKNKHYLCNARIVRPNYPGEKVRRLPGRAFSINRQHLNRQNMQNEIWKDVPGYAGLYQISNAGRIRAYSKMRGPVLLRPKNLQSRLNKHGYLQKTLVNENGRKTWDIHRLVALTFIPNPENKPCIDHINTNRTDNRVENLRWVTYSENALNPITNAKQRKRIGPMAGKYGELHPGSKSVSQFTKDGAFIGSFGSIAEAQRKTGVSNIWCCVSGQRKFAGGFIWKYNK